MELRPNSLINLGIGMPGGIGSVAEEEGLTDLFTLSLECGPLGGIPLGGIDFGATIKPEAMYRMADILQLFDVLRDVDKAPRSHHTVVEAMDIDIPQAVHLGKAQHCHIPVSYTHLDVYKRQR